MKVFKLRFFVIALTTLLSPFFKTDAKLLSLGFEGGIVSNQYNKQRIPGDSGTLFDLASSFSSSKTYYRAQAFFSLSENWGARFLYAPLSLSGSKQFDKDITFQNSVFLSSKKTQTFYQFNSYRSSFYYKAYQSNQSLLKVGFTLKTRDAVVRLQQDGVAEEKSNIGFVPLLYFNYQKILPYGFQFTWDFDGLIAPQGRAFDSALMVGYFLTKNARIHLGHRFLEGGADNKQVYNFSLFHYFFSSLEVSF